MFLLCISYMTSGALRSSLCLFFGSSVCFLLFLSVKLVLHNHVTKMSGRQAWGDDDDDDYLPPRQESAVDAKGVKSIVEYHFNGDGAKVCI